jgi:hypothetical protein
MPKSMIWAGAFAALALVGASARADEPSPAAVALAQSVLVDIGVKQSIDVIVPAMLGELERNIAAIHPEMQTALHETAATIKPEFDKGEASVLTDIARVLATRLNEQELRDTQAFFEGATGKKYLAAQPAILQELGVSGSDWRRRLSTDMLTRLREEMKKKGYDF